MRFLAWTGGALQYINHVGPAELVALSVCAKHSREYDAARRRLQIN